MVRGGEADGGVWVSVQNGAGWCGEVVRWCRVVSKGGAGTSTSTHLRHQVQVAE